MKFADLPYERYVKFGPEKLSDSDLMAMIIRTGTGKSSVYDIAGKLLSLDYVRNEGLCGLFKLTQSSLCQIDGIGDVKASQIICIIELAKRLYISKASQSVSFDKAASIANYYMYRFKSLMQEQIVIAYLNTKLKLITDEIISIGTVNSSILSPREVYIKALRNNAVYIILLHNHPSGDPTPSREDKAVTLQLKNCGQLLQIPILDHIIIGENNYFSMREHGLI